MFRVNAVRSTRDDPGQPQGQSGESADRQHGDRAQFDAEHRHDGNDDPGNSAATSGVVHTGRSRSRREASTTAATPRWRRRSTGCSRPRSSTAGNLGAASRPWNTRRANGWTGSAIAAASSRSGTPGRPKPGPTSLQRGKPDPWPRNQHQSASGKPARFSFDDLTAVASTGARSAMTGCSVKQATPQNVEDPIRRPAAVRSLSRPSSYMTRPDAR